MRECRVCGCTDDDCRGCIARTGAPCTWVADDLCSACEAGGLTGAVAVISLGDSFPRELARCRRLLDECRAIGAGGTGITVLEETLREADEAVMSGDIVRILRVYERMKAFE